MYNFTYWTFLLKNCPVRSSGEEDLLHERLFFTVNVHLTHRLHFTENTVGMRPDSPQLDGSSQSSSWPWSSTQMKLLTSSRDPLSERFCLSKHAGKAPPTHTLPRRCLPGSELKRVPDPHLQADLSDLQPPGGVAAPWPTKAGAGGSVFDGLFTCVTVVENHSMLIL
ncbi:hypothetical protein FQA47_001479 [Oryzias melastigma]|uniref:Uncharacterized protein n=1 Tax=Oryzias melastigma TaxID=30732 RepID=A0A834FRN0_ORYME|nr:hypothetical protein FQA47_001479 [Oryzias melastigma]